MRDYLFTVRITSDDEDLEDRLAEALAEFFDLVKGDRELRVKLESVRNSNPQDE